MSPGELKLYHSQLASEKMVNSVPTGAKIREEVKAGGYCPWKSQQEVWLTWM